MSRTLLGIDNSTCREIHAEIQGLLQLRSLKLHAKLPRVQAPEAHEAVGVQEYVDMAVCVLFARVGPERV